MVINPTNTRPYYTSGDHIMFDYNSGVRGFIDPKSIYLSYKVGLATTNAANAPSIIGTPVYSPFLKLETFMNSQNQDESTISFIWRRKFMFLFFAHQDDEIVSSHPTGISPMGEKVRKHSISCVFDFTIERGEHVA